MWLSVKVNAALVRARNRLLNNPHAIRVVYTVIFSTIPSSLTLVTASCKLVYNKFIGASSSGKTLDFDSSIRRFESCRPSHLTFISRG